MCKGCIPIPGVRTMAMAKDNLGAMGWHLSRGALQVLVKYGLDARKATLLSPFRQTLHGKPLSTTSCALQ